MEEDASSVGTNRTPRTEARVIDNHNPVARGYSLCFSVITTCTSLFLVVRAYRGDNLPSKHLPGFFVYTLTLGTCSSLWMCNVVWEHRGYNLPLWKRQCCYVAWVVWTAAAVTITVLFKGSYDCSKINKTEPLAFRHCHTLVSLQAFLWILVVWLSVMCAPDPPGTGEDPRPPRPSPWSRWMQWRRTRRGGVQQEGGGGGGAAEVADKLRHRNDLEAGERGGDGGDAARGVRGEDEDGQRPNAIEMSTTPGPQEPSINLGAIPGPSDPK